MLLSVVKFFSDYVFDLDEKRVLNKSVWKNESENMEIRN